MHGPLAGSTCVPGGEEGRGTDMVLKLCFKITWGPEYNAEVGLGALWDRSSSECGSLHDEAYLPPGPGPLVAFCGHIHGSPVCDRGLWWCQSLGGPGR